jgi:predicted phage terminase large subunit-like protein
MKREVSPWEAAEQLILRRKAREGLLAFTAHTHPRWITGNHHEQICDHLDALERGVIDKLIVNAPPRHSKTELASRRFPAYYLSKHPEHQIIISSYSDDLAQDISRDVRTILKDEYYQELCGGEEFPGAELDPETTAGGRWQTTKGGIVVASGMGAGITGRGADVLIIDDPHKDREDADSQRMRERVWNWYHGVATTRLMPGGRVLLMQTRWHEDDLTGRLLETEPDKWTILNLPAVNESEEALWPERYPYEVLSDRKDSLARAGRLREWNAQYQQAPTAEEGIFIKREWFKERYTDPPGLVHKYIASDLAVTDKKKSRFADFTVHIVGGLAQDGKVYILDAWRRRCEPDEWIDSLLSLVKTHKPMHWAAEAGVIRRATEGIIERRAREEKTYFDMKWMSSIADKASRGTQFKAWSSMGRIIFPKTPWAEEIIEICVGFPTVRWDDAFDAMSTLCLSLDEAVAPVSRNKQEKPKDSWEPVRSIPQGRWLTL